MTPGTTPGRALLRTDDVDAGVQDLDLHLQVLGLALRLGERSRTCCWSSRSWSAPWLACCSLASRSARAWSSRRLATRSSSCSERTRLSLSTRRSPDTCGW